MVPGDFDNEIADSPVVLPRSSLLNRYDVVKSTGKECPLHFFDYFDNENVAVHPPWISTRDAEKESAKLIAKCANEELWSLESDSSISRDLLSFVHITDVQLRRATAKLGDEKQSRGLDAIVGSFERDFEQELYLDTVLEALVETINRTIDSVNKWPPKPSFVMHGGDAIDAGLKSELQSFVRILDRLTVPWMDMIGNHDVLAFGNLLPGVEGLKGPFTCLNSARYGIARSNGANRLYATVAYVNTNTASERLRMTINSGAGYAEVDTTPTITAGQSGVYTFDVDLSGYTDEALASAATEAGISGAALDTWKKCAADRPYVPYLKGLEEYTYRVMDVRGTPYFFVNNKVISLSGVATADDFEKKLFEVAK